MRLVDIHIAGFKSYGNKVVVKDFDPEFNAITGLNGSGKSNVLDAICFVLGLKSLAQLRVAKIDELVYKNGQSGVKKATVELIFDNSVKRRSPIGYDKCDQISVLRDVQVGGRDRFTINGKVSKNKQVKDLFASVGLNVNNPHFLIMQGKVTKVIGMKPLDMFSLLEEAAGTMIYEDKRRESEMKIAAKERDLTDVEDLLKQEINPQIEKMVADREKHQKWCLIGRQIQGLEKIQRIIIHAEAKNTIMKQKEKYEELNSAMESCKQTHEKLLLRRDECQRALDNKDHEGDAASAVVAQKKVVETMRETFTEARVELENQEGNMSKMTRNLGDLDVQLKKLNLKKDQEIQSHSEELTSLENLRSSIAAKQEELKRKEQQLDDLRIGTTSTFDKDGNKVSTVEALKEAKQDIGTLKCKIKEMEGSHRQAKEELSKMPTEEKENDQYVTSLKRYEDQKKEVTITTDKLTSLNFDPERYQKYISMKEELLSELQKTERESLEMMRSFPDNVRGLAERGMYALELAHKSFGGTEDVDTMVFGPIMNLMRVKEGCGEFRTALEQIAQTKLIQTVVADDKVAEKLFLASKKGKQRVTCVPLNRIQAPAMLSSSIMAQARQYGDVYHPMELIHAKAPEFEMALRYIFGNTLIVKEAKTAKIICEKLGRSVVTIRGDSYNTSGAISGGSVAGLHDILKYWEPYGALVDKKKAIKENIEKNRVFLEQSRKLKISYDDTMKLLETLRRKLETTKNILDASKSSSNACRRNDLMEQVKQENELLGDNRKTLAKLEGDMKVMEKEYDDVVKNIGKSLKKLEKEVPRLAKLLIDDEGQLATLEMKNSSFITNVKVFDDEIAEKTRTFERNKGEISILKGDVQSLKKDMDIKKKDFSRAQEELKTMEKEITKKRDLHRNFAKKMTEIDEQVKETLARRGKLHEEASILKKAMDHNVKACDYAVSENSYITDEPSIYFPEYNEKKHTSVYIKKKLGELEDEKVEVGKNFSSVLLQKYEEAEKRHGDILSRRDTVLKEKLSIQEFILELDRQKKAEIDQCYKLVNQYFREIFETLLPGCSCLLAPAEPKNKNDQPSMVRDGLTIKVAFNKVWKTSLLELSGGQRSLIALSFVLALLKYKPAPMYILDEVDAALDLSHTQNIGKLIKTHFRGSQFIIISLKPNLFSNANVIFQTKLVAGISQINRSSTCGSEMMVTAAIEKKRSKRVAEQEE